MSQPNLVSVKNVYESELLVEAKEFLFSLIGEKSIIRVYGKEHSIPRTQCAFSKLLLPYRFSGQTLHSRPEPEILRRLRKYVQKVISKKVGYKVRLNFGLVNIYEDGNDYISYHSDDEKEMEKNSIIVSVSFGATRHMDFKHKKTGVKFRIDLEDNMMVAMLSPTNSEWLHSIPKQKRIIEKRVNITWRQFVVKN